MGVIWFTPLKFWLKVSIADYGITFPLETIKAMGSPEYVKFGLDPERKKMLVAVCDSTVEGRLEFISKNKRNYIRIANREFIKFIRNQLNDVNVIDKKSKLFKAEWKDEDKALEIDLNKLAIE